MNLSLLPLAVGVTLAWDPSPDAMSYNLYVGRQSIIAGNVPLVIYPTPETQYRVEGLDYGLEYFFVVTALANDLESGYSNEVQYTPLPLPTPTPSPTATPIPSPTPTPIPSPTATPSPKPKPGRHKGWNK